MPSRALADALAAFEERPDLDTRERVRRALRASGAVFPDTEFMGAAEAAEELSVRSPNLHKVQDLPDPFSRVRSGPFWIADDIRKLARRRQRARNNSD